MSCSYADGLSAYRNKGILGQKEKFDTKDEVARKCDLLAKWISESENVVVHTGAGISTSAGIPDFRGPNGVWTLEKKGEKPTINISFDDAIPTKTHMALAKLVELNKVQYIISQNIDGLHLKSGVPRKYLAELHGNMFIEECNVCKKQFVRNSATTSVGQKCLNTPCKGIRSSGRRCRGKLYDTILDWEASLPEDDLFMSDIKSSLADLSICLGTTMQIVPSGNLPLNTKKKGGKLVIVNLQPTKHDRKADLIINAYVDDVFKIIMNHLNIEIPDYSKEKDFSKLSHSSIIDWSISNDDLIEMKVLQSHMNANNGKLKNKIVPKTDPSDLISNKVFENGTESGETLIEMHQNKKIKTEDNKYSIKTESNQIINKDIENNMEQNVTKEESAANKIEIKNEDDLSCNEYFENKINPSFSNTEVREIKDENKLLNDPDTIKIENTSSNNSYDEQSIT